MPNRNFRLLWSGQAVSELGSEISAIATPLVVLQLTGSTVAAGVIGSLVAVVELVGRLPGGLLADRLDRKRVMVCCDVLRALASAVVAVLLAVGHASVTALAAAAVIVAALSVLFNPAQAGLLGRIVPVEQRRAAVGRNAVRTNLAIALGPPVGGLLVGLGPALAFGADALTFAVSGVLVALIAYPRYRTAPAPAQHTGAARRLTGDLTAGLRWVLRRRELLALLVLIAYLNLLGRAVELLSTFRLGDGGAAGVHAGFALTAAGLGGVAGGLCTAWILDRCRDATILLTTTATWAVLTVVLAAAPEWTIAPALFAMVFTLPPVSSLLAVAVLTDAPDELRGRVSTALSLLAATLTWAGPLLTGWLTAVGGTALCGVVLAVPLVFGAVVVWWRRGATSAGGDAPPAATGEVRFEQVDGGGAARERVDSAG